MKVTAAAVDELEGANNCADISLPQGTLSTTATHLHVVDTLVEDKFGQTRRVATERTRQSPKHRAKLAVRLLQCACAAPLSLPSSFAPTILNFNAFASL